MIFAQVFDMVDAGIVILDKNLKVRRWNRWMEIHSDIPTRKIIGASLFAFFPELNTTWFVRNCKSVFTFGNFCFLSSSLHEYCFPFKLHDNYGTGLEYMQQNCTIGPLRDKKNQIHYLYIMVQDVTELIATSMDLKAANKQAQILANKAKMADHAKTKFITNMSHEIRTPMNAIIGFTEILETEITDEMHREYLSAISTSSRALLKMINDLLDISKVEAGKFELETKTANPWVLLKEITNVFASQINEKEIDFRIDIDPLLPQGLLLDETRLRQIIVNLLANALKFTDSGFIQLSVQVYGSSKEHNRLDLLFYVQDTGIGIAPEQKDRIFEPFAQQYGQNASKYGGTGLGLTITKQLVEIMGGEIAVESDVGKGSTFLVILKDVEVSSGEALTEGEEDIHFVPMKFETSTVLIVDDVENNRGLLKGFLKFSSLHIIEAQNGREAVEFARLYHPDLILMDLRMPVLDGYEATRILKADKDLKNIPVIVQTATSAESEVEIIKKLGCDGFIRKPVRKIVLIKELSRFLPCSENDSDFETRKNIKTGNRKFEILDPEIRATLPPLLDILEKELMEKWERIHRAFFVDEIETFAKEINDLGVKFSLDILSDWGQTLIKQASSFDMEKLPETLGGYPNLVKKIAELANIE